MLHATKPIHFGSNRVGALHLCLSRTGLEKEILESQTFIYPIVVSGFLLMALLGVVALPLPGAQAPHSPRASSEEATSPGECPRKNGRGRGLLQGLQ